MKKPRLVRGQGLVAALAQLVFAACAMAGGPENAAPPMCAAPVEARLAAGATANAGPAASVESTESAAADTSAPDSSRAGGREFPKPDDATIAKLRDGGYVIAFRHSTTDWAQRDTEGENFEDRTKQRNLSKGGEALAVSVGKAIATLRIPIGPVLASPMWRCRDTAQLAFGRHQTSIDLFRRGAQSRAARITMLSTPPEKGKNAVLVTHQDVLIPIVAGLRRDQLKEGDALIVKPLGSGKYEVVAQITPGDWARLAAQKTAK